jgi:hypothetical protein
VRYFGHDFVSAHRERYGRRPAQERPFTYDIAVDDEFSSWRDWLDEQLARLPAATASELSRKVWLDRHFWSVIFELATGAALRLHGHETAYESTWNGLTPDWTILTPDGRPAGFVEVHTDNPPQEVYSEMRSWHALAARIREIPVPVLLTLQGGDRKAMPPDARTAKKIAQDLRRSLLSFNPGLLSSNGYTFLVRDEHRQSLRAHFVPPSSIAGVVTAERLTQRIEGKISKYASLAKAFDVPLTIAVGAHRFTGLRLEHLDSLMNGSMTTTFQFTAGDGFIGSQEIQLGGAPRWAMPDALAAVLWIDNVFPFQATMRPNDARRA